eukprot:CAMPEP_0197055342 /NCGR_PEP_ID=MMETSP1384-20130603/63515_1 /TAXON_ID=29189 /ORGANISM="Ammonia sp." /LENGTH=269 /DNA_ID=CAMNT_0042488887 /DNA_START=22 /DNA_END=831 /DNA_ORIENTATION=-
MSSSSQVFTWKLDTSKVQMEGNCYNSDIFCLIGQRWQMKFYKNHASAPGNATITLYLVDLPPNISQITVRRKIHILETNTISDQTKIFKDGKGQGWPKGTLSSKHIEHMQHFTIQLRMVLISKYEKHEHGDKLAVRQSDAECVSFESRLHALSTQMAVLIKSVGSMHHILNDIQSQLNRKQFAFDCKQPHISGAAADDGFMRWLQHIVKLPEYYHLFVENGLDSLDTVQMVTADTLRTIGITKVGHQMKILHQIRVLQQEGMTANNCCN